MHIRAMINNEIAKLQNEIKNCETAGMMEFASDRRRKLAALQESTKTVVATHREEIKESITVDERSFLNHSTMFGADAALTKLGRKWVIGFNVHPGIFKTKRAAYEAAEKLAHVISLRKYNNDK
jgi:hypothetical protein